MHQSKRRAKRHVPYLHYHRSLDSDCGKCLFVLFSICFEWACQDF